VKVGTKWLKTGQPVTKEEVERTIKERKEEDMLERETSSSWGKINRESLKIEEETTTEHIEG